MWAGGGALPSYDAQLLGRLPITLPVEHGCAARLPKTGISHPLEGWTGLAEIVNGPLLILTGSDFFIEQNWSPEAPLRSTTF